MPPIDSTSVLNETVVSYIEGLRLAWNVPGLAIGIVRPDGVTETRGWGIKNTLGDPVTPETLFGIGSCTKAFTSTAIGIILEKSKEDTNRQGPPLTWRTPVKSILPNEWALLDEFADSQATLSDILSHQSGLPGHDLMYSLGDDTADILRRLRFLKPTRGLREEFQYNNLMFIVASHIIKRHAGDYWSFVENEILKPLNMTSTTFSARHAKRSCHFSETWESFSGRQIPFWLPEPPADFVSGAGGLISNVIDSVKWLKKVYASLTAEIPSSTPEISKILKTTTKAHTIAQGIPEYPEVSIPGYGLGWGRGSYRGHDRLQHSGGLPGVSAHFSVYPDTGLIIVILMNIDDRALLHKIIENYVADRALGLDTISWDMKWKFTPVTRKTFTEKPPSLSMAAYAGTYKDEGYGKFLLCLPCDDPDLSRECGQVQALYNKLDATAGMKYQWQLQSSCQRLWAANLRLVSLGNDLFLGQFGSIFPDGYGSDSSPFSTYIPEIAVRFIVEDGKVTGFGLFTEAYDRGEPAHEPNLAVADAHFRK